MAARQNSSRAGSRRTLEDIPALVLRTVEFGEADLIVHLLTPTRGRVTVMAKHARRSVRQPHRRVLGPIPRPIPRPIERGAIRIEDAHRRSPFLIAAMRAASGRSR